jgi:hypothetical protein
MIVYRDKTRSTSPRVPQHLTGAADLCRRESTNGRLVGVCDPVCFNEPEASAAVWHELGDGWAFCLTAPLAQKDVTQLIRQTSEVIPTAPVTDAMGRVWYVATILKDDGKFALPVPWGKDPVTGQWERSPTPAQAAWIKAATGARAEIDANRLTEIPFSVAAEWVSTLLCATYHLTPDILAALNLLDDKLVVGVMLAAAGYAAVEAAANG